MDLFRILCLVRSIVTQVDTLKLGKRDRFFFSIFSLFLELHNTEHRDTIWIIFFYNHDLQSIQPTGLWFCVETSTKQIEQRIYFQDMSHVRNGLKRLETFWKQWKYTAATATTTIKPHSSTVAYNISSVQCKCWDHVQQTFYWDNNVLFSFN